MINLPAGRLQCRVMVLIITCLIAEHCFKVAACMNLFTVAVKYNGCMCYDFTLTNPFKMDAWTILASEEFNITSSIPLRVVCSRHREIGLLADVSVMKINSSLMIKYNTQQYYKVFIMWKQWILGHFSSYKAWAQGYVAHTLDVGTVWPSGYGTFVSNSQKVFNKKFVSYCGINKCEHKNLKLLQHKP